MSILNKDRVGHNYIGCISHERVRVNHELGPWGVLLQNPTPSEKTSLNTQFKASYWVFQIRTFIFASNQNRYL